MNPKLSIVIPCYNMGDYVTNAISSALDYPDQDAIEVIVINDGSDDNGHTAKILDTYTQNNVRIVLQKNQGLGAARNNGIKLAKAPYIIPLDADNKLRTEYIRLGIEILHSHPEVGLVYGDLQQFGTIDQSVSVGPFDASKLIHKNYIDACAVIRKSAWASIDGYDEKMPIMGYEDWDLNMRLFCKGWQFHYVNKVLYDYRVRDNSMLVNSNKNKELLLDYMFAKPELKQAKHLREKIVGYYELSEAFNRFKSRKLIKVAMKIEKPIKRIAKLFRK